MKDFAAIVARARSRGDTAAIVELVPYARLIGMAFEQDDEGLLFRLRFRKENIGNRVMPALHGGVIGAFMEHSAILQLLWNQDSSLLPKIVDFSIDYLRPGRDRDVLARCTVWRQGQRVANVAVAAWQDDARRTIATARAHFLLSHPRS